MNWTSIITALVILGGINALVLTIVSKIISNKYRKRLPECSELFNKIQTEIEQMKKASTDRQSMVIALRAVMDQATENYKELRQDFKDFAKETKTIAVKVGELSQNILNMMDSIEEIKEKR